MSAPHRAAFAYRPLWELGRLTSLVVLLVGAALLYAAYLWLDPTPAKRIVMATGPEQGAYAEFAKRYAPLLRANGVTLVLRPTQGSQENLALLRDPRSGVQVAFVQSSVQAAELDAERVGAEHADADRSDADRAGPALASLGSVAFEPLWLFYRQASVQGLPQAQAPTRLAQLSGWRINTGPAGGGAAPLLQRIAPAAGLAPTALHAGNELAVHSVVDLVQGRDDALALVSAADAPFVQYLLHTPEVRLFDFVQAEAFARRFPFLHALRLPRGLVDPATDDPPADVQLVAATASLVARADLHPALVQLLVQAAQRVHGDPGWFSHHGQFPNLDSPIFPPSPEAVRFYRYGPPWLQSMLPFWLANFIDRMWIVMLPLLAVLLPLARVLPPMVELRLRSRVYRWYRQLRALDEARASRSSAELLHELDGIEARVAEVQVPLRYADELYALRAHIDMVRRSLAPASAGASAVLPADER